MTERTENTIDPKSIRPGFWVPESNRLERDFKFNAVGQDVETNRWWVHYRQIVPSFTDGLVQVHTSIEGSENMGIYPSRKAARYLLKEIAETRDVPEDESNFLLGVYAEVTDNLTVKIDDKRQSIWRLYTTGYKGIRIFADRPPELWGIVDDYNLCQVGAEPIKLGDLKMHPSGTIGPAAIEGDYKMPPEGWTT